MNCSSHSPHTHTHTYKLLAFACAQSSHRRANAKIHYNYMKKKQPNGKEWQTRQFQFADIQRYMVKQSTLRSQRARRNYFHQRLWRLFVQFAANFCTLCLTSVFCASIHSGKRCVQTHTFALERRSWRKRERKRPCIFLCFFFGVSFAWRLLTTIFWFQQHFGKVGECWKDQ